MRPPGQVPCDLDLAARRGPRWRRGRRRGADRARRRRGLVRPEAALPRRRRGRPAAARRGHPRRPGRGRRGARRRPRNEGSSSPRARTGPVRSRIDRPTTSPPTSSPTRLGPSPRSTALHRRHRARPRPRARHGHVPRRRPGQRQPAPDDRHAIGRRGREGQARAAPRPDRQGRLLRLRRHQHQAGRPDGRDEDGQDRCVHRDRGHRHRRPPLAGDAAARGRGRSREHARIALDAAGRRGPAP